MFVRYAPGSCGNFLISMLQISDCIAHWYDHVEKCKGQEIFDTIFFDQFKKNFTNDSANHLKNEPHHPYQLDFFSAKMPKGNDIDLDDFINCVQQRSDQSLIDSWARGQFTVFRLNKSNVPKFGYGSTVINIVIDVASQAWLNRCRLIKLFGKKQGAWISKENDPEFLKYKFKSVSVQNQYQFNMPNFSFIRRCVIQEPVIQLFQSERDLMQHESNLYCDQSFLLLGDILDKQKFMSVLHKLYDDLELGPVHQNLVDKCYDHYYHTNILPFFSD